LDFKPISIFVSLEEGAALFDFGMEPGFSLYDMTFYLYACIKKGGKDKKTTTTTTTN